MEANVRKFTILTFIIFAVLFGFLFFRGLTQVLDWMRLTHQVTAMVGNYSWTAVGGTFSGVIGFAGFLALALNTKAVTFFDEVYTETKKVTWPTAKETYASTLVVVIMVLVAALMLFLLDNIWNWVFKILLS